jgi:hypothetical protein
VKRFLTYVATLIYLFGIVGFLWNFSLGMFGVKINGEMPLFDIQRIEETNNRIYVGLGAYKRVQVYDLKGNYLKFITVHGSYESYFFFVDEQEQLDVPKVYPEVADQLNDLFMEESDYQITSYFPLVISKKQNGKSTEVIRQTWLYLFAPVSSLLVAGLGGVLVFALNVFTIIDVMNLPGDEREKRKQFFKRVYGRRNILE